MCCFKVYFVLYGITSHESKMTLLFRVDLKTPLQVILHFRAPPPFVLQSPFEKLACNKQLAALLQTHTHQNTQTHTHTKTHKHPYTKTHKRPHTKRHKHPYIKTHKHPYIKRHKHPNARRHKQSYKIPKKNVKTNVTKA